MSEHLTEPTRGAIDYIAMHMRDEDWNEIVNLLDHDSRIQFGWQAYMLMTTRGRGRVVWHDRKPAIGVAFIEHRPGLWDVQMYGTDDFRFAAKHALRWIRDTLPDLRDNLGGRRLQADSHIDHVEAHRFMRMLGARQEGEPMRKFGKDGSSYLRFVWIDDETDKFPIFGKVEAAA